MKTRPEETHRLAPHLPKSKIRSTVPESTTLYNIGGGVGYDDSDDDDGGGSEVDHDIMYMHRVLLFIYLKILIDIFK
jgi:hypothetical protein